MKAKVRRVQEGEFDFSTLSDDDFQIYVDGLLGSLISTVSTQCLVNPSRVALAMEFYFMRFDENDFLSVTRKNREYIQKLIKV